MAESPISFDSSSEDLADYFMKNCKLSLEQKELFIKEGISGDVLLEAVPSLKDIGIKPTAIIKIKSFLKNKEDKFKPKEIAEKISISNEKDITLFFEKYIGFKGDLNGKIKEESELLSFGDEDMKKIGLNFGQRIRLIRYINHFRVLKSKKDITITITKESNEKEVNEFLKNELNFCENSIEESGLDAPILFDLTEENLNDYSELIKPEEFEMLKKFIKKRDEMIKKQPFGKGKDEDNFIVSGIDEKTDINKFKKNKVYEVENIQDIIYSPMKKSSFQQNKKYNVFFY